MSRGERRARTNTVAKRRADTWQTFNNEPPTKKRAGSFRTQTALGCGCTDHNGMCHATSKSHEPLVERRNERKAIEAAIDESDA